MSWCPLQSQDDELRQPDDDGLMADQVEDMLDAALEAANAPLAAEERSRRDRDADDHGRDSSRDRRDRGKDRSHDRRDDRSTWRGGCSRERRRGDSRGDRRRGSSRNRRHSRSPRRQSRSQRRRSRSRHRRSRSRRGSTAISPESMPLRSRVDSGPLVEAVSTAPPPIPSNFRAGDWMCPKCNFHNYRSKLVCPQCSTPMPPGGNPLVTPSSTSTADLDSKRRKTKWDDDGPPKLPKDVPHWLQDLVPPEGPKPPPGIAPENFKVLRMEGVQIRALIGKGGETIREIRQRSGADVKIDHLPQDLEGTVTIVGDVEKTEKMIREALSSKGCPLSGPRPLGAAPLPPGAPGPYVDVPEENEMQVPPELVGPLIGPGGATIKDIRAKAGGGVFISVLPPAAPGGPQNVRIVGDNREHAKELVRYKIEELKKMNQRPPAPVQVPPVPLPPAPPAPIGHSCTGVFAGSTVPGVCSVVPPPLPGVTQGMLNNAARPGSGGLMGGMGPRVVQPPPRLGPGMPAPPGFPPGLRGAAPSSLQPGGGLMPPPGNLPQGFLGALSGPPGNTGVLGGIGFGSTATAPSSLGSACSLGPPSLAAASCFSVGGPDPTAGCCGVVGINMQGAAGLFSGANIQNSSAVFTGPGSFDSAGGAISTFSIRSFEGCGDPGVPGSALATP